MAPNKTLIHHNAIYANNGPGISVEHTILGPSLLDVQIYNNEIGRDTLPGQDPQGNGQHGIFLKGRVQNVNIHDNTIIGNGWRSDSIWAFDGIALKGETTGSPGALSGNRIQTNTFTNNGGGLGINVDLGDAPSGEFLASEGQTPNDVGDDDTGPNGLINYPVIDPNSFNLVDGVWSFQLSYDGELAPQGDFMQFEFFKMDGGTLAPVAVLGGFPLNEFGFPLNEFGDTTLTLSLPDGTGPGQIAKDDSITVVATKNKSNAPLNLNASSEISPDFVSVVDTIAPTVMSVMVSNSTAEMDHQDYTIPVGSGDQLRSINIGGGIDQVTIMFSEDVMVDVLNLTITDVSQFGFSVTVANVSDPPVTNTATWTFNKVPRGQLLLKLEAEGINAVTDVAGNGLDGEWENPNFLTDDRAEINIFPSGDGMEGGDFLFRITVLPGDADPDAAEFLPDNKVGAADYITWANNWGMTDADMWDGDFFGSNAVVDTGDYSIWANNFGIDWVCWPGEQCGESAAASEGASLTGPEAAIDAVFELYTSDALLLDSIAGNSNESTPLWEQHAKSFFGWGEGEIHRFGLDGFLAELEAWLMPLST